MTYFDDATVDEMWTRIAAVLQRFSHGAYLTDLRVAASDCGIAERAFDVVLSGFVQGEGARIPRHGRRRGGGVAAGRLRAGGTAPRRRPPSRRGGAR